MRDRPLTAAEALAASAFTLLASVITGAYLWARVGHVSPFAMLGFAAATGIVIAIALFRRATRATAAHVASVALLAVLTGWLLWLGGPTLLPPGGGGDLTHHLQLVDYLERHWQLPDESQAGALGEMAHYTPGVHFLAALAGAWTGSDGLHAIFPLLAFSVALKTVLVFLIALRLLPVSPARVPLALTSVVLLLLPQAYFLGSFLHDSFLAQALAELFAVAMWWALVVWDEAPSRLLLLLFSAAGIGAFLTWPMWIGPPLVALAVTVLTRDDLRPGAKLEALALATTALAAVVVVHTAGRVGWLGMAGAPGAVVAPSVRTFGWPFLLLGTAGLVVAVVRREARTTVLLTLSIAAQAATLYALARSRGTSTPYMALKMMYLSIYPLAVFGTLALATLWHAIHASLARGTKVPRFMPKASMGSAILWALLLLTLIIYRRPLTTVSHPPPVVSEDLYAAGRWARANLESACVDYLVPHADTMYWLHLAVLGNPRASLRTANPDTFVPARAIARWIEPGGLPYGIAHLPALPKDVLNDVDILEQFGTAAVVKRRGPATCLEAQRFARGQRFTPKIVISSFRNTMGKRSGRLAMLPSAARYARRSSVPTRR